MVTARVADYGLAPRRSPFQRAAGEENFGPKSRFNAILSGFEWCEPCSRSPVSWEFDPHTWYPRHRMLLQLYGAFTRCYKGGKLTFKSCFKPSNQPKIDLTYSKTDLDSTDSTSPRWSGVGVRVSAPVRRGAAPCGDGSRCSQTRSHLISLLP